MNQLPDDDPYQAAASEASAAEQPPLIVMLLGARFPAAALGQSNSAPPCETPSALC